MVPDALVPREVRGALDSWGIKTLFPPQEEVARRNLITGGNFVLAAPTASGKTLAAELPMVYDLFTEGKVVFVVPLRALASEKFSTFSRRYGPLGFRVRMTVGDYDSSEEPLSRYDLILTTYEKFDSIIRHRPSWVDDMSTVVFDEIHYAADNSRGPSIEMAIAKLMDANPGARRIALSATIANIEDVAKWLEAEPVRVDWRPVPLRLGAYCKEQVLIEREDGVIIPRASPDTMRGLILEGLAEGGQALVFYLRRRTAVGGAKRLARAVERTLISAQRKALKKLATELLQEEPSSQLARELASLIGSGVAFHHAGLSHGMRSRVEEAFKSGLIKVITATPTLAAGVNLPARTVIVTSHMRYDASVGYSRPISTMEFKQMAGRAGRPDYDEFGEALIVAKSTREGERLLEKYVLSPPEPISSSLHNITKLRSHILSLVALKGPVREEGILEVLMRTLFAIQGGEGLLKRVLPPIIDFLKENGFVQDVGGSFRATRLGRRVSQLYIDPSSAILMVEALEPASRILRSDLLDDLVLSTLQFIGVLPDMPRMRVGRVYEDRLIPIFEEMEYLVPLTEAPVASTYEVLQTIKLSVTLRAWIEERTIGEIESRLGVEPGDLYFHSQNAVWLLYSFSEIAKLLGSAQLADYLKELMSRVKYGVKEELLPLVAIRGVGRRRGRVLFNAGYSSPEDVASADISRLAKLSGIGRNLATRLIEEAGRMTGRSRKRRRG